MGNVGPIDIGMMPEVLRIPAPVDRSQNAREELAANVSRFEQLVAQHSDYLRRIELLLDELDEIETGAFEADSSARPTG
jgi:hypothetical protein